jgi:hypothetical protein
MAGFLFGGGVCASGWFGFDGEQLGINDQHNYANERHEWIARSDIPIWQRILPASQFSMSRLERAALRIEIWGFTTTPSRSKIAAGI